MVRRDHASSLTLLSRNLRMIASASQAPNFLAKASIFREASCIVFALLLFFALSFFPTQVFFQCTLNEGAAICFFRFGFAVDFIKQFILQKNIDASHDSPLVVLPKHTLDV